MTARKTNRLPVLLVSMAACVRCACCLRFVVWAAGVLRINADEAAAAGKSESAVGGSGWLGVIESAMLVRGLRTVNKSSRNAMPICFDH